MDFVRNRLWTGRIGGRHGPASHPQGATIDIYPGQVEEAVHTMPFIGAIDISGLSFYAYPRDDDIDFAHDGDVDEALRKSISYSSTRNSNETIQSLQMDSIVDIVVFEIFNDQCTSQKCDISNYGVGQLEHFDGIEYVSLCQDGRLRIDSDDFTGRHVEIRIPSQGRLPDRQIADEDGLISVPESDRTYEVIIANCNKYGRKVLLTGQVLLLIDKSSSQNYVPETNLVLFGIAICLIFSFFNIRIRCGTRADYNYEGVRNIQVVVSQNDIRTISGNENGHHQHHPHTNIYLDSATTV